MYRINVCIMDDERILHALYCNNGFGCLLWIAWSSHSGHNLHICFSTGCKIQDSFSVVIHQHSCKWFSFCLLLLLRYCETVETRQETLRSLRQAVSCVRSAGPSRSDHLLRVTWGILVKIFVPGKVINHCKLSPQHCYTFIYPDWCVNMFACFVNCFMSCKFSLIFMVDTLVQTWPAFIFISSCCARYYFLQSWFVVGPSWENSDLCHTCNGPLNPLSPNGSPFDE